MVVARWNELDGLEFLWAESVVYIYLCVIYVYVILYVIFVKLTLFVCVWR